MTLPVGSERMTQSPLLLNPLPMLPSTMNTTMPLKFGKSVKKSTPAAIIAKLLSGSIRGGIKSVPTLSAILQPVKSIDWSV